MKRTIRMKNQNVWYGGKDISWLRGGIRKYFKLENSEVYKYVITIVEGTQFCFSRFLWGDYTLKTAGGEEIGTLCIEIFDKLFFTPDVEKTYDIIVKKVRR